MKIINRKAYHEYFLLKEFTSGIQLVGSEVKSLRNGDANLRDSFIYINDNEVFIKGLYISKHKDSSYNNHEENRDKKLLLKGKEIRSLIKDTEVKGMAIIPIEVFELRGRFKLKIAIAKGKKLYDKKAVLKEKDIKRETQRDFSIKY